MDLVRLRPLTLTEPQQALAVEAGEFEKDDGNIPDEEFMISSRAGPIIVDKPSNSIRFVHHTTREYFESIRMKQFPSAQKEIATACLSYLSQDKFAGDQYCSTNQAKIAFEENPLLHYAAQHSGNHVHGDLEQDPVIRAATIDEKDGNGQTTLQLAAANGKEANVPPPFLLLLSYPPTSFSITGSD